MGLESHVRDSANDGNTDSSHALDGIWNKPVNTSTQSTDASTASDAKATNPQTDMHAPVFTDSDGTPVSDAKLAGLTLTGYKDKSGPTIELAAMTLPKFPSIENDVTTVSDRRTKATERPTVEGLAKAAHDSVGSDKYGNKVPSNAKDFAGFDIPKNLKCASTSSQWLINSGMMTNSDYKIQVNQMMDLLPQLGFKQVRLNGDLDLSKFPDGPIGFITGRKQTGDGSSHIGFIEKVNGQLRVIHNNYETGRVVDQNIKEKFYKPDGKPAYKELNMFIFPRK